MRIFSRVLAATLIALAGAAAAQQPMAPPSAPAAAQAALERGLGAYRTGRYDAAIAALGEAAAKGDASARFVAEFYLARSYSENVGPTVDHTKAFVLFRKIADENLTADPETSQRAPFVAKALIALAGYVRAGVKEIDLPPNPRRAADYLHHAAVFFGDKDAQFELARVYLGADAPGDDIRRGLHYLAVLTEDSYAPAQAMLADLYWRGRYVKKDDRRALALVTLAAENAPAHERIWIDDSYAGIFCAAAPGTRQEAADLAAKWRKMFVQPAPESGAHTGLGGRELGPQRQCASGEAVAIVLPPAALPAAAATPPTAEATPTVQSPPATEPATPTDAAPIKSGAAPAGFRAAGLLETAKK